MRFADILHLPQTPAGLIREEAARRAFPDIPLDVLQQVVVDHGANDDFQRQYGELDLNTVVWSLRCMPARELINASMFSDFSTWFHSVFERTLHFSTGGWSSVDQREQVAQHWRTYRTWARAPVFLTGNLTDSSRSLHLVEGHTRLAVLSALVHLDVIESDSTHQAWVGAAETDRVTDSAG